MTGVKELVTLLPASMLSTHLGRPYTSQPQICSTFTECAVCCHFCKSSGNRPLDRHPPCPPPRYNAALWGNQTPLHCFNQNAFCRKVQKTPCKCRAGFFTEFGRQHWVWLLGGGMADVRSSLGGRSLATQKRHYRKSCFLSCSASL